RADARQRQAILQLTSGKEGLPWAVFASLTAKLLDPVFARFEVLANGLSSRVSAAPYLEMELTTINNPVTGKAERLQLRKPTGFTSLWADLGRSKKFRVATPGLAFEHSNLYGEFSEFDYTEAGPRQPAPGAPALSPIKFCMMHLPHSLAPIELPTEKPPPRTATLRIYLAAIAVFAAAAALTIYYARGMAGGMRMPGGWTMSMMWMMGHGPAAAIASIG